jgi:hypothetical protein
MSKLGFIDQGSHYLVTKEQCFCHFALNKCQVNSTTFLAPCHTKTTKESTFRSDITSSRPNGLELISKSITIAVVLANTSILLLSLTYRVQIFKFFPPSSSGPAKKTLKKWTHIYWFILTLRPEIEMLRALRRNEPKPEELSLTSGKGLIYSGEDIREHALTMLSGCQHLANKLTTDLPPDIFADMVQLKSKGNFLYVKYLMDMLGDEEK